jgi:hypothetical protein
VADAARDHAHPHRRVGGPGHALHAQRRVALAANHGSWRPALARLRRLLLVERTTARAAGSSGLRRGRTPASMGLIFRERLLDSFGQVTKQNKGRRRGGRSPRQRRRAPVPREGLRRHHGPGDRQGRGDPAGASTTVATKAALLLALMAGRGGRSACARRSPPPGPSDRLRLALRATCATCSQDAAGRALRLAVAHGPTPAGDDRLRDRYEAFRRGCSTRPPVPAGCVQR